MKNKRQVRVGEQIQRTLAQALIRHAREPVFLKITITGVKMSPDLAYAKVFFSAFDDSIIKEAQQILQEKTGFLRKILAHDLNLRITPHLQFVHDESISYGRHISELIDEALSRDEKLPKE